MPTILVHANTHPYLADRETVPMSVVLEWFAATATKWLTPRSSLLVLRDIDVEREVPLTRFQDDGDQYWVNCHLSATAMTLRLIGPGEVTHYRATMPRTATVSTDWQPPPNTRSPARAVRYDEEASPPFRALKGIHDITPYGAVGEVIGAEALGWPKCDWHTDPAAIEGGLQLAELWAGRPLVSLSEFRLHRKGLLTEPAHCIVLPRGLATCDIGFADPDGKPRMELLGVS